jgi:hypothetical protein
MVGLMVRGRAVRATGLVLAAVSAATWLLSKGRSAPAAAVAVAVLGAPGLLAADDVRTFAVTVDGKPAGTYTISTAAAADGTETTTVAAAVRVKFALYTYVYELNSTEVWKNGRLVSVDATSNDDGKKRTLSAVAGDRDLTVKVNRDSHKVAGAAITSTGVRVPAEDKARDAVMVNNDDGIDTPVKVEPLGAGRVTLNGQAIDGARFKLTGKDVAAEWWFDKNGRVLHQEMKWDGHKVVLQLTAIK